MNPVARTMMAAGNKVASWLYIRSKGRLGGSARGVPVLVLTVPGRRTGKERSVPVAYFGHNNSYLVAATAGGSKRNPQWVRNLAAAGKARIQIGEHRYDVDSRIADGPERAALWENVVVAQAPAFAKYEEKSGRAIPIALLTLRT